MATKVVRRRVEGSITPSTTTAHPIPPSSDPKEDSPGRPTPLDARRFASSPPIAETLRVALPFVRWRPARRGVITQTDIARLRSSRAASSHVAVRMSQLNDTNPTDTPAQITHEHGLTDGGASEAAGAPAPAVAEAAEPVQSEEAVNGGSQAEERSGDEQEATGSTGQEVAGPAAEDSRDAQDEQGGLDVEAPAAEVAGGEGVVAPQEEVDAPKDAEEPAGPADGAEVDADQQASQAGGTAPVGEEERAGSAALSEAGQDDDNREGLERPESRLADSLGDASTRPGSPASSTAAHSAPGSAVAPGMPAKKFSRVNINTKFLGKAATPSPSATTPGFGGLGAKPGLGSLGSRPGVSPSGLATTSSRMLTSVKLTKTGSGSGSAASAAPTPPPMGWQKTPAPGDIADLSKTKADDPPMFSGLAAMRKPALGSRAQPGMGLLAKKKGWGSVPDAARVMPAPSRDFPTAKEVVEGQREAENQARLVAQAQAAHHQALLQGLDSFRGRKRDDPNAHYWDDDDEDGAFDQVLDFGDGTTYTIPAGMPNAEADGAQVESANDEPVSKEQRFAEDFDRSWPPRGPVLPPPGPAPTAAAAGRPGKESLAAMQSRQLFNERSNRLEAPAERLRKQPPGQLLTRSSREAEIPQAKPSAGFERPLPPHLALAPERQAQAAPPALAKRELPPHLQGLAIPSRTPEAPVADRSPPCATPAERLPLGSLASTRNRRPSELQADGSRPIDSATSARPERSVDTEVNSAMSWRNDALAFNKSAPTPQLAAPPPLPAQAPPVAVPAPVAAAESSPAVEAVPTPVINIGEMQKDEMHSAAERAKARREAEEAEREAQKERARRKAKELEERLAAAAGPKAPVLPPPSAALQRPPTLLQRPQRQSQPGPTNPPGLATQGLGAERVSPVAEKRAAAGPQRASSSGTVPTVAGTIRADAAGEATVPSQSRPAEPARADRPQAVAAAALKAVRPEVLERSSWRRSAAEVEAAAQKSQAALAEAEPQQPPKPSTTVLPPPALSPEVSQANSLPPPGLRAPTAAGTAAAPASPQKSSARESQPSTFDDIMARIKSAMVDEHTQRMQGATPTKQAIAQEATTPSRAVPRARARMTEPVRPRSPPYIPGPRPLDFLNTRSPTPEAPPAAWKTQLVKLPKASSARRTMKMPAQELPAFPENHLVSWEPPLQQLNPITLSRDDMLMGQRYIRGRLVTVVSLPKLTSAQWQLQAEAEFDQPTAVNAMRQSVEAAAEHQAAQSPSGPIVVRLPGSSRAIVPTQSGGSEARAESPLDRQRSPRRAADLAAVSFAKPQPSLSGNDSKGSVRFLMESHLEDTASKELLDEVLGTSQDAMDGPLEEEEPAVAAAFPTKLDTKVNTSSFSSPMPSGPPSPSANGSMGRKSTIYPVSQSPGRPVDRDHLKSVWSAQPGREVVNSSNSLRGITDDLPQFSMPMQDLPETKEDLEQGRRQDGKVGQNGNSQQEELDVPQFASVGAVSQALETSESPAPSNGYSGYAADPRMQSVSPYGVPANQSPGHAQSPISAYGYAQSAGGYNGIGMAGSPLGAGVAQGYPQMHRLVSDGSSHMSSGVPSHGIPGQMQNQIGRWVPASQSQIGSTAPGMYAGANGKPSHGGSQMSVDMRHGSSPGNYMQMLPSQDGLYSNSSMNSAGIYSNANGGPLDSPSDAYGRMYQAGSAAGQGYGMGYNGGGLGNGGGYGGGQGMYQSRGGFGGGKPGARPGAQYGAAAGYNPAVGSSGNHRGANDYGPYAQSRHMPQEGMYRPSSHGQIASAHPGSMDAVDKAGIAGQRAPGMGMSNPNGSHQRMVSGSGTIGHRAASGSMSASASMSGGPAGGDVSRRPW